MSSKHLSANNGGLACGISGVGNNATFNVGQSSRYASLLNPLLEKIIDKYDPVVDSADDGELPDPDEKLKFNDVRIFAEEISDCIGFLSVVEEQIDAIDDEEPGSKDRFLRAINQNYKNHRRQLLIKNGVVSNEEKDIIGVIRANADVLIMNVTKTILDYAEVDLYNYPVETVQDSTALIVCYGFINCKILEKPDDYK